MLLKMSLFLYFLFKFLYFRVQMQRWNHQQELGKPFHYFALLCRGFWKKKKKLHQRQRRNKKFILTQEWSIQLIIPKNLLVR